MKSIVRKVQERDIPTKIIKVAKLGVTAPKRNCINKCISSRTFPDKIKFADIIPIYKKQDLNDKTNY